MYAEVDFLLALIKDDDWLSEPAEKVYEEHVDELWTSDLSLIELMLVAYREDRNVERIVTNVSALLEVRGDEEGDVLGGRRRARPAAGQDGEREDADEDGLQDAAESGRLVGPARP